MVDSGSLGEESERVKQLEDGVARLVDRQYYHPLLIHTQTGEKETIVNRN